MITSLFGRRSGIDVNGYEVGEYDTRLVVETATSGSSATALSQSGITLLNSTATMTWAVSTANIIVGIYKQFTQISTSTLGLIVQFGPNANIVSSNGSSFNQATFAGIGHTLNLFCFSTAPSYAATANFTTASGMSLSTY